MLLRAIIPSQFLRISVLTGYLCAIVIGSGLHIHVDATESDGHSHGSTIANHSHDPVNADEIQHCATDFHTAEHKHAVAEFVFTATRGKDYRESILSPNGAFVAICVSVNGASSDWNETALDDTPDVSYISSRFFKALPSRAPPLV